MTRILRSVLVVSAGVLAGCTPQSLPQVDESFPISLGIANPSLGSRISSTDNATTLSWMERTENGPALRFAQYADGKWRDTETVVTDDKMFVNWADLPTVTPLADGQFLAHWLSYSAAGDYTYDILLSRGIGAGDGAWSEPIRAHDDNTHTEHGFVSLYPQGESTGLVWLDGRFTPDKGMTLRTAVVDNTLAIHDATELDALVCDCCQTDVATGTAGPLLVYRNRTDDEVRDIYWSRQVDGVWQPGKPIADDGWIIEGCPVNGPAIAAYGDSAVVAWFTGANDRSAVKFAVSSNAGRSFGEPVVLAAQRAIGHVDVAMIDAHSFAVTWMESDRQRGYNIQLQARTLDGQAGETQTVGKTSLMQTVPQLARSKDELLMSWTDVLGDETQVVAVRMTILGFYD